MENYEKNNHTIYFSDLFQYNNVLAHFYHIIRYLDLFIIIMIFNIIIDTNEITVYWIKS